MAWRARLLLSLGLIAACPQPRPVSPEVYSSTAPPAGLGPGDVFEVRVYGDESLSAQYRVENDGTIDFPFLGRIEVASLSSRDVAAAIRNGLQRAEILVDPQVTVFVAESNSLRVSVMGAVARPGTFPVVPGMTAAQAISMAGGFTALASQNDTVLTRRNGEEVERFPLPMRRISEGRERDVELRGGDILFVPERVF